MQLANEVGKVLCDAKLIDLLASGSLHDFLSHWRFQCLTDTLCTVIWITKELRLIDWTRWDSCLLARFHLVAFVGNPRKVTPQCRL